MRLPVAGVIIKKDPEWAEYRAQSAISDSPFEKVWTHKNQKSVRLVSTSFSKTSELCTKEKTTLHKQNFLVSEINKKKGYSCAFKATRGTFVTFVAIKELKRSLPRKKTFVSQAVFIEQNSNTKSFHRWLASIEEIKK